MSRKGFTLIELLVVVAVLALLASIVFSNLGGAREGARISNALSFQSQTHSLLGSDLVGWWNFNGDDAKDLSGYGNNGTITGPSFDDGVSGTGGRSIKLNGSSGYVNTNGLFNFAKNDSFTVSFWINSEDHSHKATAAAGLVGKGHWYDNTWDVFMYNSNRIFFEISGNPTRNGIRSVATPVIELETWHHYLVTYNNGSINVYLNSKSVGSNTYVGDGDFNNNNTVKIGIRHTDTSRILEGLIDDVRIYSRALTAGEIKTLYVQTKDNYLANE